MKSAAKPISSPGRTDKFPPPLMRFLRTNVGSKSRGRSRSSPMFVRKKNNTNHKSNNTAIETQEPSSPKVTCMGQVRVKRSSKQTRPKKKSQQQQQQQQQPFSCRCHWIPSKARLCRHFPGTMTRPKLCRTVWSKWVSLFQLSFRRKVGIKGGEEENQSKRIGSGFESRSFEDSEEENDEQEDEDEDEEEEKERKPNNKLFITSLSPPKNALILTRCRSAPYRSSSLACRFWGSPLNTEEEEEEEEKQSKEIENKEQQEEKVDEDEQQQKQQEGEEEKEREKPSSEMEKLSCEEAKIDPEIEEKSRLSKEFDGSNGKRFSESSKTEDVFERPSILTRCKSEPARTREKLDPEMGFWRNRRLGIVNYCSSTVL